MLTGRLDSRGPPIAYAFVFSSPKHTVPMPQHESAKKRMRQNAKKQKHNKSQKSRVRSKVRTLKSIDDPAEARELLNDVKGELDRLAAKGLIHKNKAANKKSALEQHVNNLEDE